MGTKALIISDLDSVSRGKTNFEYIGVNVANWTEAAAFRLDEYETVIVDTRNADLQTERLAHMRGDLTALLSAGGTVFVLAGPSDVSIQYDFMPDEVLRATRLPNSKSVPGRRFVVLDKQWDSYFYRVSKYYKTVEGIVQKEKSWVLNYFEVTELPLIPSEHIVSHNVQRLAITEITSQVIACVISFMSGTIVLLPPPDETNVLLAVQDLSQMGAELRREQVERLGNDVPLPAWLDYYKSPEQRLAEDNVTKLQLDLSEAQRKLTPLRLVQSCLYSTGVRLESSVKAIFAELKWDVDDLTKRSEPIDFTVQKSGVSGKLQVALTGTSGYIASESKKFGQLLAALPSIKPDERLVFLVNALAMENPSTRQTEKCITPEATRRLTNNEICILFVHDLYKMWIKYKEGKLSSEKIFDSIYQSPGLFEVNRVIK